jgi:hypothetical protein
VDSGILMSALSTMFWMAIANMFFASPFIFQLNLYAGLIVMCGFVLYDTQMIIEKRRNGDTDFVWFVSLSCLACHPVYHLFVRDSRFEFYICDETLFHTSRFASLYSCGDGLYHSISGTLSISSSISWTFSAVCSSFCRKKRFVKFIFAGRTVLILSCKISVE